MTIKPDKSYFIDYQPTTTGFDLIERVQKGINLAASEGFDTVFIVEDDDFYPADYFNDIPDADFIGDTRSIYYHLGNRSYQDWTHPRRASLYNTGFKISALNKFQWPEPQERFLDLSLWSYAVREHKTIGWRQKNTVGIKHGIGLCGGKGHVQRGKYLDQEMEWLKANVDSDAFIFYSSLNIPKR